MTQDNQITQQVISVLELHRFPEEQRDYMLGKVMDLVTTNLILRLLDMLEGTLEKEFRQIMDGDDQKELQDFLLYKVPNIQFMLVEEVTKIKTTLSI